MYQKLCSPKAFLGKGKTALRNLSFAVTGLMLLFSATPGRAQSNTAAAPKLDDGFRSM